MFEIWSDDNELIKSEYKNNNFLIREYNNSSDYVAIYFSSNGIYYPNEEEVFKKCIIEDNRFEWMHYRRNDVCKEIFVRDIYKQWYVSGINDRISDIPLLIEWLKDQIPDGKRLITVGSSAGGYMAILVGLLLNAEIIYSISGTVNIESEINDWARKVCSENGSSKYLDITELLDQKAEETTICYLYSAFDYKDDIKQLKMIKDTGKLCDIGFKTSIHAEVCYKYNYKALLALNREQINRLYKRVGRKPVSRLMFSIKLEGLFKTGYSIMNMWIKKHI